jgi:hypothetical protein
MTTPAALAVAKEFHHAFELCQGNGFKSLDDSRSPSIPAVVNLAFAIELAMKAVLFCYSPAPRGHELVELFGQFPDTDQAFIRGRVHYTTDEFDAGLDAVNKAFIEWRYIHEHRGLKSVSLQFLMILWSAVCELAEMKREEHRKKLKQSAVDRDD